VRRRPYYLGHQIRGYASSTPGQSNETFAEVLGPAAKFFHGWLQQEMLLRETQAPDTSVLRASGRRNEVSFLNQCNTVIVNRAMRTHIEGKNIIVFDDFSTSGMSLEWARILLRAAGAAKVTLVSFGKYGKNHPISHQCFELAEGIVTPFQLGHYQLGMFRRHDYTLAEDDAAMPLTQELFRLWKDKRPYRKRQQPDRHRQPGHRGQWE
jgi:hypothetical protein